MDFFDQICQVIAENEAKRRGSVARSEVVQEFFAAAKPLPAAVKPVSAVPETRQETRPQPVKLPAAPPPAALPASLEGLCRAVQQCQQCGLCRTRNNTVFGEGSPHARLMFIGEGPGADEDRTGRPFVGKAGQLLDKMIGAMQFSREEVYITNIVKCRPPDNRLPSPEEAAACMPFLHEQINIIRPEVIVLLGATAVKFLLNTTSGINRMRGRWTSYENIPVITTSMVKKLAVMLSIHLVHILVKFTLQKVLTTKRVQNKNSLLQHIILNSMLNTKILIYHTMETHMI